MSYEASSRFPIRFDEWFRPLSLMVLIPPAACFVEVTPEEVFVQMAWAFRARFPRAAIASVGLFARRPLSRGVHGWAGRWLVNGSGDRIVAIQLEPEQRAFILGLRLRLRELLVSVEDPPRFIERIGRASRASA